MFPGAMIGRGAEVRINGVVQVIMARQSAFYASHAHDVVLGDADDAASDR